MPYIDWDDKLSVGIPSIDAQHKKLVAMVNELFDAMKAGNGKEILSKTLTGLVDYTVTHFNYEEKLFAQTAYSESASHKKEHENLKREVLSIQEKMRQGITSAQAMQILEFLKKWLVNHIQGSDKKYGPHLVSKGIK